MASPQHYAWAGGHILLLLTALRYLLAYVTFSSGTHTWWYKAAYLGALVSYSIVCHKSMGAFQPNAAFATRFLTDENSQYLLLAFAWFLSKPVPVALIPFAIFSLFHTLTFVRTTVLPQVMGQRPAAPGQAAPPPPAIAKTIQQWVKTNYDPAMKIVAYVEIFIFARLALGLLVRQSSILSVLVYIHFIRMRYVQSMYTRDAFARLRSEVDARIGGLPPIVGQVWGYVLQGCSLFIGSKVIEPQPAPNARRGTAPAAK
ncbi:hypothetical protein BKA62DRAFT_693228 [Auriculariales sp. MPI-PUGE-AT-0066]|nr:hypothetical protein BKA62DRAFT_693228 [Auriculariales sp. MPI-PUGE-AT-0066]